MLKIAQLGSARDEIQTQVCLIPKPMVFPLHNATFLGRGKGKGKNKSGKRWSMGEAVVEGRGGKERKEETRGEKRDSICN